MSETLCETTETTLRSTGVLNILCHLYCVEKVDHEMLLICLNIHFCPYSFCSESKSQSAAMPACTLAFASLCLQNALMLLKSAEVIPAHEPESVLESQLTKEDESHSQETDALRYVTLHASKLNASGYIFIIMDIAKAMQRIVVCSILACL